MRSGITTGGLLGLSLLVHSTAGATFTLGGQAANTTDPSKRACMTFAYGSMQRGSSCSGEVEVDLAIPSTSSYMNVQSYARVRGTSSSGSHHVKCQALSVNQDRTAPSASSVVSATGTTLAYHTLPPLAPFSVNNNEYYFVACWLNGSAELNLVSWFHDELP